MSSRIEDWVGKTIRLGVATDHGGFVEKRRLLDALANRPDLRVEDLGPGSQDPADDYPDFATRLARKIARGDLDAGILICRSGIGMSIAANRFPRVRAALASTVEAGRLSRTHNAANVLVIGSEATGDTDPLSIVEAWLDTPFSQALRHVRRLHKIETLGQDETAAVRRVDPEIAAVIEHETTRQQDGLELIASENFASPAVRVTQSCVMTNKYAEGYPGKRYYNGCEFVDEAERLAIRRACDLFSADFANVQAHSGSQANMAAYFALLQPGDTVLAMSLDHGGHLTHGMRLNFSGMLYNFVSYGVNRETELLDYDEIERLAREHQPKLLVAGASAYPRSMDFARLRSIADSVGAHLMVDMAHIAGLVAAGEHESPVPHAHITTSTTHKTLRGPRGGLVLTNDKALAKTVNSRVFPGLQGGPLMHVIAAKAVCFHEARTEEFREYQHQVVLNARALAGALAEHGFRLVSGGTDTHLMLVDLQPKKLTGKVLATALDHAGITVNKNLIPFDPESPFVTSGIRIGTPALTTRGMKEAEMRRIGAWIGTVADRPEDEETLQAVKDEVREFARDFPLPRFVV